MSQEGGLSKNELKKLAKKAEKAAAKSAVAVPAAVPTALSTAAPRGATAFASGATPALATTVPTTPTLRVMAPQPTFALLKLVWTAQLYRVSLATAVAQEYARSNNFFLANLVSDASAPILLLGTSVVGGGGNAMAVAVAGMNNNNNNNNNTPNSRSGVGSAFLEQCNVDHWLEWERTVLRTHRTQALRELEDHFVARRGQLHLVGHEDSVADVCVLVTLSHTDDNETEPTDWSQFPAIRNYVQAHTAARQAACDAMTKLVKEYQQLQQEQAQSNPTITLPTTSSSKDLPMDDLDLREPSLVKLLYTIFLRAVVRALGADPADVDWARHLPTDIIRKCQNPQHGDYQCIAALRAWNVWKQTGQTPPPHITSPAVLAAAVVAAIGTDHPVLTQVGAQETSYVVCRIRPSFLEQFVNTLCQTSTLPWPVVTKQTCVVDFSSPNIAKEMHVGHLRSTILGESVCRILEAVGHEVHRVNHVGDWGTQFGMLIQYLRDDFLLNDQNKSDNKDSNSDNNLPNITDLTEFYKNAKKRFDEDAEFKKQSQQNVVLLQSGDPDCRRIWNVLCEISRHEFEKVYQRLDVVVHECGESFYNDKIPAVIEEFKQAGLLQTDGGAQVVFVDKFKNPLMLQKSDGGYGYDSTDMAALKYRLFELRADRIIVITDSSQQDHFKMIFGAGRRIGWLNDHHCRLEHIGFGTVNGEDGKRFKTRSGDTVRLVDLLDEAVQRMVTSLTERIAENKANITLEEVPEVAEAIGYGAVKYYDLRRNPTSSYKFSYDQMLDTKGDTAVYLLYTRVRLESILSKAQTDYSVTIDDLLQAGQRVHITHESERNLVLSLANFVDTMVQTLDDLYPYHICEYVYKLANAASDFVTQCKVLGSEEMNSRLLLCHVVTIAMRQSFDLLGIRHVKRI